MRPSFSQEHGKVEIRQQEFGHRNFDNFCELKPIWKACREGEMDSNILRGIHNCHTLGISQKSFMS